MTETSASLALGIDIGGTKIAIAAADRQGHIHDQITLPTDAASGSGAVFDRIASALAQLSAGLPNSALVGIGIACPGPVDPSGAVALNAVNLGWQGVSLRHELTARGIHLPIFGANDVNAGALGEGAFGAARGVRDYVYLAVGTGLGGGAVIDGQLLNGVSGTAMEVGHVALSARHARQGRLCACKRLGCAETVISGIGLLAGLNEALQSQVLPAWDARPHTVTALLDAARLNDPTACAIIAEAADALGTVMAWCATVFNPAMIVIGGGLGAAAYDLLMPGALEMLHAAAMSEVTAGLRIEPSQVLSSALGASALVWQAAR